MWKRWIYLALVGVALVSGYPYVGLILNRVLGTSTVVMIERDGTPRSLIMGPSAPLPAWLPVLPRALTVTAAHWLPSPDRPIAGGLDLLTHKSVDDIKGYYIAMLANAGFAMRDDGFGPAGPAVARYLGIENGLVGERSDGLSISVLTRSAGGFVLPSRIVQIHWGPTRLVQHVP